MSQHPHEPDELEPDPAVPPRPEEVVADAARQEPAGHEPATQTPAGQESAEHDSAGDEPARQSADRPAEEPVGGGDADGPPAQGEGRADSH